MVLLLAIEGVYLLPWGPTSCISKLLQLLNPAEVFVKIAVIHELGSEIARQWSCQGTTMDGFPSIAAACLNEFYPRLGFELEGLVDWLMETAELPFQLDPDNRFGHPPLTLYAAPNAPFVIDAYLWMGPDIAIHDHCFGGACAVVGGSSYHVDYSFALEDTPQHEVQVGKLSVRREGWLEPGSVFEITPGRSFVHRIWHLARPTISLVPRTLGDAKNVRQFVYFETGIALDSTLEDDPTRRKRFHALRSLQHLEHPDLARWTSTALCGGRDADRAWAIMHFARAFGDLEAVDRAIPALPAAMRRHADAFVHTIEHSVAMMQLVRPGVLKELHERYALALLCTHGVGPRSTSLLTERFPQFASVSERAELVRQIGWRGGVHRGVAFYLASLIEAGGALDPEEDDRLRRSLSLRRIETALLRQLAPQAPPMVLAPERPLKVGVHAIA